MKIYLAGGANDYKYALKSNIKLLEKTRNKLLSFFYVNQKEKSSLDENWLLHTIIDYNAKQKLRTSSRS